MANKDKQKIMAVGLSIFIAFILWIYVMGDKNPPQTTTIKDVSVTLINKEYIEQSNLALLPNQNFTVNITVVGRTLDIVNLTADDFKLEADMSGYLKEGSNNIPVQVKSAPRGVEVSFKNGSPFIRVELDTLAEKVVPVKINIVGGTAEGYGYLPAVSRPTGVYVSGPETDVNSVVSVFGQVDVTGAFQNINQSVALKAQDANGNTISSVSIDPKYVDTAIEIKPAKEVPIKIETTGELKGDRVLKSIVSNIDKVIIIGDKKYLDRVTQIKTVSFDVSNLDSSSTVELILNIPPGVSIFNEIRSIDASFIVENMMDSSIEVPITTMNSREGYEYTLSSNKVTISLRGSESSLNTMDIRNIGASVDLKELEEGTHTLSVNITLPEGITLKDGSESKITITVIKKQQ